MMRRGQQATRNYAKRQFPWFANQPPPEWARFTRALEGTAIAEALALLGANA
jgi:tRNA dimethylallyltransferase